MYVNDVDAFLGVLSRHGAYEACRPGSAINNVFGPEWLRMATTRTGTDGDEEDTENDNDSKADDWADGVDVNGDD